MQALAPRRSPALAVTDRRQQDDAMPTDGVVCLDDDTPLTIGLLRELLSEARVLAFSPGHSANRIDLALLEAIDGRIPNPWA